MDGKSTFYANQVLSRLRGVDLAALANVWLALFDAAGAELTGSGYARKQVTADGTNFPAESNRLISNGVAFEFAAATAAWNDIFRLKIMDAASGGNDLYRGFLGTDQGAAFTAIAAGDVITVPGTTLVVNDRVAVLAIDGSTLPAGLTDDALYFVKTVVINDITLSLTQGGAAVDVTAAGSGVIKKVTPKTGIATGDIVRFGVGEIQIKEA